MRYFLIAASFLVSIAACAQEEAPAPSVAKYVEGKHYTKLSSPVPSVVDTSKNVEITEVFRFGCPACARFEKAVISWKQTAPEYIEFVKSPVIWNKATEKRAEAFFAGKALGYEQEAANAIFDAIHVNSSSAKQANSVLTKNEEILDMLVSLGAEPEKANKMLTSFGVKSMVNKADGRARSFAVNGTPEIFVDGRYRVTTSNAQNYGDMLAIATYLSEKVAKERGIVK